MENIVPIEELRKHISRVLEEIRYGVAEQRNAGLVVDMPEEVEFQCQVIFEFQSHVVTSVSKQSEESQQTQKETSSETSKSERTSKDEQEAATSHKQKQNSEQKRYTKDSADA
jgi:hypothetical protein